jgi:DMSO/TMAO reductase YedYZ molybdopterin-dependent catalytic subunit
MIRISRRQALRLAAFSILSGAVAACGLGTGQPAPTPTGSQPQGATPEPGATAAPQATPTPTGRQPLASGPSVAITPIADFYNVSISQHTDWIKAEGYTLAVGGAVAQPLKLSLSDLKTLPIVEQMRTLECISNPVGGNLISNAMWKAVRLGDVLHKAGLKSSAIEIKISSADSFHTSIPVALAINPDSLLAFEMNGETLPNKHGFPLRALFPGRYGMKQPKWITAIDAITSSHLGYWERQGWSNDAFVRVNSQFYTPEDGDEIAADSYPISGIVFASDVGVAKVEVSTDGGATWNEARLLRGPTHLTWGEWRYDWSPAAAGRATLIVRATDNSGAVQPLAEGGRIMIPDSEMDGVWATDRVFVAVKKS